ncbi:helix-turn-helix transcriptional regulator [Mycolicibacterium conceptionense]|uniref:helix-turn-helix transcriptional regulator n=1 Tax=Mycolicibacterium conceptionense TaxID=451644 RepID=UPI002D21EC5D|nr:helix-turn-helix transcriptional regulator [Mycolicibacterium conceptionense]
MRCIFPWKPTWTGDHRKIAQQAKMPVGVFITAFRAAFHTTPYQYLLDRRFERAKFLLRNTTRPVADISAAVGFSNPGHFSTAFRHRIGVSPRAYCGSYRLRADGLAGTQPACRV